MKTVFLLLLSVFFLSSSDIKKVFVLAVPVSVNEIGTVGANVKVYNTYFNLVDSFEITDKGGYFTFSETEFVLMSNSQGFRKYIKVFDIKDLTDTLLLKPDSYSIHRGSISLRPISFQKNSFELDPLNLGELNLLRKTMIELQCDTAKKIVFELYASYDPTERKGKYLRKIRLKNVSDYLSHNCGIKLSLNEVNQPFNCNATTEEDRMGNRQVRFKVVYEK